MLARGPLTAPISFDVQYGRTALHLAAKEGHSEMAKALIESGCDKEAKDRVRHPPLLGRAHQTARRGCWSRSSGGCRFLVGPFAGLCSASRRRRRPPIATASPALTAPVSCFQNGFRALHYAAYFGFSEVAKALMERGCDVDAKDGVRRPPPPVHPNRLRGAAAVRLRVSVRFLIASGAPTFRTDICVTSTS